ncbi:MAG: hypothetical protein K2X73_02180 [Sphingomonas sp.]|uniref:DUF6671 family protein n=1 Tax=Sphingomonas sp. TaxID=28214 RepID=UPI0025F55ED0|nr:DUF6671 family protein [Sphingomonas sp.]MBX9880761.1 hypothetical protein [Sphingomonas sp.]
MHAKEAALAEGLAPLCLTWLATPTLDTDRFGTFTREVPRAGTQLEAARAKALAALAACPQAELAVASEGAFGPHPALPIVPAGRELVLVLDRLGGELVGHDLTIDTNYAQAEVESIGEALDFAARAGFPEHGVLLMAPGGGPPVTRDLGDVAALVAAVEARLNEAGRLWIETDMRAHRNPRRQAAIARAAADLARRWAARCPACARPDFTARTAPGRPCAWCGGATDEAWRAVARCAGCGHEHVALIDPERRADPGSCAHCNP